MRFVRARLERVSKMFVQGPVVFPQGLKPLIFVAFLGPAKAVPLLQSRYV
jgi:hypothetical protein